MNTIHIQNSDTVVIFKFDQHFTEMLRWQNYTKQCLMSPSMSSSLVQAEH